MNAIAKSAAVVTALWCCAAFRAGAAAPSFVYETPGEFLAAGDFNGDGVLDVLVLDKITGNARVGYSDNNGNLTWSAPLVTGVGQAEGCGVGRWLQSTRDAIAVTASSLNRVNLVDLSGTNSAGTPVIVTPLGVGPHTLVPLADPLGGVAPAYNDLLAASSDNNNSAELLDLMGISAGVGTETGQFGESGPFDRGNALQLSVTTATFAAGLVRGSNDTLDVWQFTNLPNVMLSYSNLPSGSDYAFGIFNGETLPRFLFYQPGGSNVTVVALLQSGGAFSFGTPLVVQVSEPVQQVFYVATGATDGSAQIMFSNGIQGLRLPGGSPVLGSIYSSGTGAAGNVFTGVVPLGSQMMAVLDAPPGGSTSVHGQVLRYNGTNYTQLSSTNLPAITARTTRANVWLFEAEPFVNRQADFIASFNTPDWSQSVSGLPGALAVITENDGGTASGLGSPGTNSLGAPPVGSFYGLPNQYNQAISLFSYAGPQAAEPVTVTISPPPGIYDGPITIFFFTLNATDKVFYRKTSGGDSWHAYTASFPLTNDGTIEYYGTNAAYPTRSQLQLAAYSLGINGQTTPTVNLASGTTSTNPPPAFVPDTNVVLSPLGTIFYGRRSPTNTGSIWAINFDGSSDTYITTGVRPRVSRDGHWMAFLRGGSPFQSKGNVWVRNLQTSQEQRLFVNPGTIVCYDWMPDDSGLILDFDCGLWTMNMNGVLTELLATDCYEQAPVLNPIDGRIAFHDLNTGSPAAGLYVAAPGGTSVQQIVASVTGASWPSWSPDGLDLAFADDNSSSSLDDGTNLWVVPGTNTPGGLNFTRICNFTGTSNHFPHGALWSPDSTSLVGAGTIGGTNGLWIIPLNADRSDCQGGPILLPTTPGDSIDFAGSIVIAQPAPLEAQLLIERGSNAVIISWGTNFVSTLQYTTSLAAPVTWQSIPGPYTVVGDTFQYQEPLAALLSKKYFRLAPSTH